MRTKIQDITCARMVAHLLQDIVLIHENKSKELEQKNKKISFPGFFERGKTPRISLKGYTIDLAQGLHMSNSSLILALIYIERVVQSKFHIKFNRMSFHKIVTMGFLLAMKYNEDEFVNNSKLISELTFMDAATLRDVERAFLKALDFNLYVTREEYRERRDYLIQAELSRVPERLSEEAIENFGKRIRRAMKKCSCRDPVQHGKKKCKYQFNKNKTPIRRSKTFSHQSKGSNPFNGSREEIKGPISTASPNIIHSAEKKMRKKKAQDHHEESTQDSREGSFVDSNSQPLHKKIKPMAS